VHTLVVAMFASSIASSTLDVGMSWYGLMLMRSVSPVLSYLSLLVILPSFPFSLIVFYRSIHIS
jgi:hypothetical protein